MMKPYHPEKLLETIDKALKIKGTQPGEKSEETIGMIF
jgi:hypothetical protein